MVRNAQEPERRSLDVVLLAAAARVRKRPYLFSLSLSLLFLFCLAYTGRLSAMFEPPPLQWLPPSAAAVSPLIPRKIWQVLLPMPSNIDADGISDTRVGSWMLLNPDYTYTRLGLDGATEFIRRQYPDRLQYLETFQALQNPALKSDFLRYLVLLTEGGVYTDLDTTALQPVHRWVPERYRTQARVLAGIEWDQRDETDLSGVMTTFRYPVQFQQWTLAAAPGHPILADMVEHILLSLDGLTAQHDTELAQLQLQDQEILEATGPVAWTAAVWKYIRQLDPSLTTLRNLSNMQQPTLYGDVLVFPVNSFASGQEHSGSARWRTPPDSLVKHHFAASWRVD